MRPVVAAAVLVALSGAGGTAVATEKVSRLDIVDRAIELHGGATYTSSTTSLTLTSRSGSFDLEVRTDGPRFDYTITETLSDGVSRHLEVGNESVELRLDGETQTVAPDKEQRWRDFASARVYFCFLPYRLNDDSVYKEDLGIEVWEERELHKVKVTFEAGSSTDASDEYLYWFDPESGRLEQFAYSFEGNPGGLRFRRLFNYRRIGGILFFDQENLGVEGEDLTVDQIRPEFVARQMRGVSTVELSNVRVAPTTADL